MRAACERHLNDIAAGQARGLVFDPAAAAAAIRFFTALSIEVEGREGAGEGNNRVAPFVLQPWQEFVVGSLFGWKNDKGLRRFRRAYVEVAKGNGKSPMAAGIGHYFLAGKGINKERGEVYGDFDKNALTAQSIKKIMDRNYQATISESLDMIASKLARIRNGDEYHLDNWIDIAGYAQLVVKFIRG